MKDYIVRADYAIPVGYECFVHNLHILKWPTTEVDNIGVVEVSVGCKEHPISIKFIKYLFTTMSTNEDFEYTFSREDDVYTLTYHDGWGRSEFKIYKLELETPCSEYTLSFEQRLRMDNEYNDDPEKGLSVEYYESDCLNF